jgi:hypothetical protein
MPGSIFLCELVFTFQKNVGSSVKYYRDDPWLSKFFVPEKTYEYSEKVERIEPFDGTHPEVMKERINRKNWKCEPDLSLRYGSVKDRIKGVIGDLLGWYPGEYRNNRLVK